MQKKRMQRKKIQIKSTLIVKTTLLFQWQFRITYSGFWLINTPLWKCDISSKKRNDLKHNFFDEKQQKNAKKEYVHIK